MNLKPFLNRTGLTQSQLAKELNTFQSTVSSWAVKRTEPNMQQLRKLLVMGMTLGEMFDPETEAIVLGRKHDDTNLCKDIVNTGIAQILGLDDKKINDPEACARIVEIGFKELIKRSK